MVWGVFSKVFYGFWCFWWVNMEELIFGCGFLMGFGGGLITFQCFWVGVKCIVGGFWSCFDCFLWCSIVFLGGGMATG